MNPSEDQLESNSLFDQSIVYTHSDERLLSRPKHLQSRISNIISKPMDKDTHHDHDDGDSKKVSKKMAPLPDDFRPGENDVICKFSYIVARVQQYRVF